MKATIKQISSLDKIFPAAIGDVREVTAIKVLGGQQFSYQLAVDSREGGNEIVEVSFKVDSPLKEFIRLYAVKNVPVDIHVSPDVDDDYLTKETGLMPDMLMPLPIEDAYIRMMDEAAALWVAVTVPEDFPAGEYPITITAREEFIIAQTKGEPMDFVFTAKVLPCNLPKQTTKFTQWFHTDCIADYHNVPVYSEAHWDLIDKYMALYAENGGNVILTPLITPALDVGFGLRRTCVQLVGVEKNGETYAFDFSKLARWISLVNKNGIEYFEMSHLFSQWGLAYTPNIKVTENGEEKYLFGWHMESKDPAYKNFLEQFLPALLAFLKEQSVKDRCYFHISDEPNDKHLENYQYAHALITPLIEGCPTLDALSNYDFYERGLVTAPATATDHIEAFLEHNVPNQWAYYCGSQGIKVSNRFIAMPSYRNRVIGLQMYKYDVKGFLQWGYNFYNSQLSRMKTNPYMSTSNNKSYVPGDAFSVYPLADGAAPSLRAVVFKEALDDIEVCRKLEEFIGKDAVVKMIDDAAGMNITFKEYPRNKEFIPNLMEQMMEKIKEYV